MWTEATQGFTGALFDEDANPVWTICTWEPDVSFAFGFFQEK